MNFNTIKAGLMKSVSGLLMLYNKKSDRYSYLNEGKKESHLDHNLWHAGTVTARKLAALSLLNEHCC